MPESGRLGQMLCLSLSGAGITDEERRMLRRVEPGCILLFARSCQSPSQVRALTDELRGLLGDDTLLAIDQEGGRVDRLRSLITPMPGAEEVAAGGGSAAVAHGSLTGRVLRLLGFNFNFAPVLDYLPPDRREIPNGLATRIFGPTPQAISAAAIAYLSSLQTEGVMGCIKHFPGLGGAELDPHDEFPVVKLSARQLAEADLLPFREAITAKLAKAVMISHAAYPALEPGSESLSPASLSARIVTGLLRDELGFAGVAVTDDLTMGAAIKAAGSLTAAAKRAIAAGQDLLLLCDSPPKVEETHAALAEAMHCGEISRPRLEQSFARLGKLRSQLAEPDSFDEARLKLLSDEIARFKARLRPAAADPGINSTTRD